MDLIAYFTAKKFFVSGTDEFRKIRPNKLGLLTNKEEFKNKYRWVSSAVPLPFHASPIQ